MESIYQIPYISNVRIATENLNITQYRTGKEIGGIEHHYHIYAFRSWWSQREYNRTHICWCHRLYIKRKSQNMLIALCCVTNSNSFKVALIMLQYFLNNLGLFSHLNWKGSIMIDLTEVTSYCSLSTNLVLLRPWLQMISPVFDGSTTSDDGMLLCVWYR